MRVITAYAEKNPCYKAAQKMPKGKPEGIVVHSTGANNPNLKRYVDCPEEVGKNLFGNHWNRNVKKCVHAFIGYDKNKTVAVANILPYDVCCWGVGSGAKGSYNYNPAYIQFEICEDNLKNESYFDDAFEAAVEYCAFLCKKFDIPVDKIVSHYEAGKAGFGSLHADCDHWLKKFGKSMTWFRTQVKAELEKTEVKEQPFAAYRVKVTASVLNIRKGAGTNYKVSGQIRSKGVFTIVAEADGKGATKWGKLKSGAGWISLDYVKKL